MDGLESFRNANIIPRFFILDDGWQVTKHHAPQFVLMEFLIGILI
jgi:hypothetical protein